MKDEFHPKGNIEVEFIEFRPGEKMHDELSYAADATISTERPKVLMVSRLLNENAIVAELLSHLENAFERDDEASLGNLLLTQTNEINAVQMEPRMIPLPAAKGSSR